MEESIYFDDRKNLDGSEDCRYYLKDLRKEVKAVFNGNLGGGSLMVWDAISWDDKCEIIFTRSTEFIREQITFRNSLLLLVWPNYGLDFILMQDNASIHTSNEMK